MFWKVTFDATVSCFQACSTVSLQQLVATQSHSVEEVLHDCDEPKYVLCPLLACLILDISSWSGQDKLSALSEVLYSDVLFMLYAVGVLVWT